MPSIATLTDGFDYLDTQRWESSYGEYYVAGGTAEVKCKLAYSALLTTAVWSFPDGAGIYGRVWPSTGGGGTPTEHNTAMRINHGIDGGTDVGIMHDQTNGNLYFESRTGYWDASRTSVTYNATNHAWWRLDRTGSTNLRFSTAPTSGNGPGTWTVQRTMTVPSWVSSRTDHRLILETHRDDAIVSSAFYDGLNLDLVDRAVPNNSKGNMIAFFM